MSSPSTLLDKAATVVALAVKRGLISPRDAVDGLDEHALSLVVAELVKERPLKRYVVQYETNKKCGYYVKPITSFAIVEGDSAEDALDRVSEDPKRLQKFITDLDVDHISDFIHYFMPKSLTHDEKLQFMMKIWSAPGALNELMGSKDHAWHDHTESTERQRPYHLEIRRVGPRVEADLARRTGK